MPKLANIKNLILEKRLYQKRLFAAIVIITILSLALILRLAYLQIFMHHRYSTLSKQNYIELMPIAPNRGLIYDRNGILVAEDVPVFSLEITPYYVKNLKDTISELQKIVSISPDDLDQFYKDVQRRSHFDPIPLKVKLTESEVARFSVEQYRFPGVMVEAKMIRKYPLGPAMESVLGYVGRINATELRQIDAANYSASTFIGKTGIEKYYENELHGKIGYKKVEIDAGGRPLRVVKTIPPVPGNNLYLTIDSNLQQVALKAFGKERGALVAIQPNTGQVLALVSSPSFDPNLFVQGISSKDYQKLQTSPDMPLYNRALRGQFPMASTIKPFLALEGLDSGIITPSYTIYDPGWFRLPKTKHIYHDWKRGGHGAVNITDAIIVSCDTYFYNLAVLMGMQHIDDILNRFGFGRQTGIDIVGEAPGLVPTPQWKLKMQGRPWYTGDTIISAIGQGFMLTTPVQLATATAALAERGLRFKPYVLLGTKSPTGQIESTPIVSEDPVMIQHPKVWNTVIKAMEGVVKSSKPFGTARIRFGVNPKYSVAVKTGTAQVASIYRDEDAIGNSNIPYKLRNHSLFIVFAPVKNPKIAVAIVVEHSPIAGTIARKVLDYYLLQEQHNSTEQSPWQKTK